MKAELLLVDDEANIRKTLSKMLRADGYHVDAAAGAEEARRYAERRRYQVLITDLKMPDGDGISLLKDLRAQGYPLEAIVMTAYGTIDSAVEAMKAGAYDYITKPFDPAHLSALVEKALEKQALAAENAFLRRRVQAQDEYGRLVGTSPAMAEVYRMVEMVAPSNATVLLEGESGVGKEVIARTIHQRSQRSAGPLVSLNCGAVPESLLESELFGYEKGAFTGAHMSRPGKIELAHGGTLFLDEVSEMEPRTQIEFLRVLDRRELRRLGGTKLIHVDIRIIAATNKRLDEEVASGRFRKDLYYRLNVVPIRVPPLRERKEDIIPLAQLFLDEFTTAYNKPPMRLSEAARECLLHHEWPGNVRELRNLMERLTVLLNGGAVGVRDLPPEYRTRVASPPSVTIPLGITLEEVENIVIRKTLAEITSHRERAAEILGISPRALHYKLSRLGLKSRTPASPAPSADPAGS